MTETNALNADLHVARGCLRGEAESFRTFVQRFRESVYRLSFRILGQHEDAEDVVQETFVRAFSSLHHWDQERPLRPWLLTIAANRCRTTLAKRGRSHLVVNQELTDLASQDQPRKAEQLELAEELQRGLETLKPEMKECFVLFYRDQLSCAQIAARLERPEGTIKTWLHRSRNQLAEYLSRRNANPMPGATPQNIDSVRDES